MNNRVRAAMVGGGLNSAVGRTHEIAMKMDSRFQLVAGCFSRHAEINAQTGVAYGVEGSRIYPTPEDLLKGEATRIDAVVIATPIGVHEEYIHLALDHGLTVICDKPLLANLAQCRRLLAKVPANSPRVYSIFNYTGYPAVREIRRRVAAGEIGKVFKIMAEMPQDSYLRLKNQGRTSAIQSWRLVDGEVPCLSLDLFVHLHSLVNFITDAKPQKVSAWSRAISGVAPGLVDEVDAVIQYDSNLMVNAWYGKAALGYRNGLKIRIFGSRGSYEWVQEDPETIAYANAAGDKLTIDRISTSSAVTTESRYNRFKAGHPSGFIEAFANYYWDIADAMEATSLNEYTLSTGVAVEGIAVCHAIQQSSRDGRAVPLTEVHAHD